MYVQPAPICMMYVCMYAYTYVYTTCASNAAQMLRADSNANDSSMSFVCSARTLPGPKPPRDLSVRTSQASSSL